MVPPAFTITRHITASPHRVWQALVDPAEVAKYHFAPLKHLDLKPGGSICYGTDAGDMIVGEVREIDPEKTFSHSFRFSAVQDGTQDDPETLVSYQLESSEETLLGNRR